jgi:hypothetical protein
VEGPTGLNTPAGGLPDPETWWRTPEIIPPPALPVAGPPLPRMWWDEAPVPPPVVVAAADPSLVGTAGSTGSITLPPPASGEIPVAPASALPSQPPPDATTTLTRRELHRPRRGTPRAGAARPSSLPAPPAPPADGTDRSGEVTPLVRRRPAGDSTSELVRPYVTGPIPLAGWTAVDEPAPQAFPVAGRSRRAREGRDTLGTHLTPPTGLTGMFAGAPPQDPGSLFDPPRPAEVLDVPSPWAAPAGPALPSRKELRTRQRQTDSTRAVATRKLARTGVVAVTAFGVVGGVAAAGPTALSALGVDPTGSSTSAGQAALGLEGAPSPTLLAAPAPGFAADQVERSEQAAAAKRLAVALESRKRQQVDRDKRDGKALQGAAKAAARTLADVAAESVRAEAARKEEIAKQALRNVIRDPKAYARTLVEARGWSSSQFRCLDLLWKRESGWNYKADNPTSSAYGIPQALPGSRMASEGSDWRTNPATQIKWGLNYIAGRYGTPCAAWAHSERVGWY